MPWVHVLCGFGSPLWLSAAALVLFQRACEEERVTAELIFRLATLLRRTG